VLILERAYVYKSIRDLYWVLFCTEFQWLSDELKSSLGAM